ncbi:MAG: hypothetical protein GQ582_12940 [Methyloprofundus sp.]|nr:hypothetical protein [Methyloprofundus sp.]
MRQLYGFTYPIMLDPVITDPSIYNQVNSYSSRRFISTEEPKERLTTGDVIIGFEGWNHPLEEGAGEALDMTTNDNRTVYILRNGVRVSALRPAHIQGYQTGTVGNEKALATSFTNKNLLFSNGSQIGKLIVYGYSAGGDAAIEFVNQISHQVDLLIVVDSNALTIFTANTEVYDNTREVINYIATTAADHGGQAGKLTASNASKTEISNITLEGESHASIYKNTRDRCINHIRKELSVYDYIPPNKYNPIPPGYKLIA